MTKGELQGLLFGSTEVSSLRRRPDYEWVQREMTRSGVTLSLLWYEYCEECRLAREIPLMYTQSCLYCRGFAQKTEAICILTARAEITAYIFVAMLSSRQYAYVEAFLSQKSGAIMRGPCQCIQALWRGHPHAGVLIAQLEWRKLQNPLQA